MRASGVAVVFATLLAAVAPCAAQVPDSTSAAARRPVVAGGFDDKPYLTGIFGRIAVGGYLDFQTVWERADGATEEAGSTLKRWNLLTHTRVSPEIDVWAEVEFEDGGEEIVLELAQVDFRPSTSLGLRCGMLLLPLGRFNLSHDGPRNEFTDRPLLATDLIGTALSMPGLGLFGEWPLGSGHRAIYDFYAVNGYHDGIIDASADGTRLPAGRSNPEDENASPALVGRLAWDAGPRGEVGLSGYRGTYNLSRRDGLDVDAARFVRVGTLDLRADLLGLEWNAEGSLVEVDIPSGLVGIYASQQTGWFLEVRRAFAERRLGSLPAASVSLAVRLEGVDFDRSLAGDSRQQLTFGLHLRPSRESVFKLDYRRGRDRDRFNNASQAAAVQFSLATYF